MSKDSKASSFMKSGNDFRFSRRSHDSSYILYRLGRLASAAVKQFAETGKTDTFDSSSGDQQQQLKKSMPSQNIVANKSGFSVFDEFNLPAIITGAGRSESKFFVDSNHSLISLMTRIVPSPDWFIGIDSFQDGSGLLTTRLTVVTTGFKRNDLYNKENNSNFDLYLCLGGSWIDKVTIEMDPLDAGSDNGFTFTAPNWPTSPQGVIYRITSKYPAHPAGSFFYPTNKRLPPIATVQLIKLKEYELSEVFHFAEDDRKYEVVHTQTHLEMEHNHVEMNNELSASIEQERQNEIAKQPTFLTEKDRIRSQLLAKMNPLYPGT
uniref:Spondin domain-containing protein n=1 Tax=Glossina pallidipes TaxID=7398 RepID=A0A1B0A202_GLOPL